MAAAPTRRPRSGLLVTAAAVAALAVLAPVAASPPPPTLSTSARLRSWSCPASKSWHAVGGDNYELPTRVRLPAAAINDEEWAGMGTSAWWRLSKPSVGYDIIQFRPMDHSTAPLRPGAPITYRFTAPVDGHYRWSMKAAVPHPTDHNDIFVRWSGTHGSAWGMQKRASGRAWAALPSATWHKVYTNKAGGFAWGGYTKDHDAHMLITGPLVGGKTYEFQMTGRSCQIQVAAFGLMQCEVDGDGSPGCANVDAMDAVPMAVCQ